MASSDTTRSNIDHDVVEGFGREWSAFPQESLDADEHQAMWRRYFAIFPWDRLPAEASGFDLGCGSGRWAALVAPRVGTLHCIDPAAPALEVAKRALGTRGNVRFHLADAGAIPLPDASQDFGYSLGVLHHIPDTARALRAATAKLKPGAPFLVYLYYRFDQRPAWFRRLWQASEIGRAAISALPFPLRKAASGVIAGAVYWPLSRAARIGSRVGADIRHWPLSSYRECSFYTLRTDALDRFGTRLEQRFTRPEITAMMEAADLTDVVFSEAEPYWVACGIRR